MELLSLAITSIIFFFFVLHGLDLYRKRRMPPGPAGLPIIGNLLDIGANPHESLARLSKKHGPLMTIRLGSVTTVVASTPDAAREILQHSDVACSGRTIREAATAMNNHASAVIWIQPNQEWRTLRKALNTCLTQKQKLDTLSGLRQNVMGAMLEFLKESGRNNKAVDIDDIGGFKTRVKTVMEVVGKFNIGDIFPLLKPLDPQNIQRKAKKAYSWLDTLIEGFISTRLKHRESKLPRFSDVLDSLLDYSQDHDDFKLKHVNTLLVDMFLGGTETSSNTAEWAMTELLLNPHMFSRVREEVSATVGKDGKIQEAKILELPYLQAVIKEAMRLHLSVPLLVPHKAETEIKLGNDYIVPKNTQILVNAWAIARDTRYWDNPLMFNPERFLGNEVDYKGQHFEFLPFGSGRRICPGIPLAIRVVSFMVASFVYHFDWRLPYAREEMDMNVIFGLTLIRATPLVATPVLVNLV